MDTLSPALLSDLRYAVSRFGMDIEDVPRDHEGMTITGRLALLQSDGESYCNGEFRKTDLRSEHGNVWELFPENPATIQAQHDLTEEVGELLEKELMMRLSPHSRSTRGSDMPVRAHVDSLVGLLGYIDGSAGAPEVDPEMWAEMSLFEEALNVVPGLREAEVAAITREQLVAELASGAVPAASAVYVRRALDSDTDGLRNADITLATYRVAVGRLRDAAQLALDSVMAHFAVAERIRKVRDDLEAIDRSLHWPGPWQTTPMLAEVAR